MPRNISDVRNDSAYSRAHRSAAAHQPSAPELADAIEVLPKSEGKNVIDLKVLPTGAQFRIAPLRDPQQPRLWCVSIRQSTGGSVVDTKGPAWIDRPGVTLPELTPVIESLRADIVSWLAVSARAELCRWLLTAAPLPTPAQSAGIFGRIGSSPVG